MLGTELVREIVARKERGEGIKRIAPELGVAGLLRVGTRGRHSAPPRFGPDYGGFCEVMVRDLQLYETVSQSQGGDTR